MYVERSETHIYLSPTALKKQLKMLVFVTSTAQGNHKALL